MKSMKRVEDSVALHDSTFDEEEDGEGKPEDARRRALCEAVNTMKYTAIPPIISTAVGKS